MGVINAFILCNDDHRAYVGDEIKITLTTTAKEYQGYITYISEDGLTFVINGRLEFDFRIDNLKLELVARGTYSALMDDTEHAHEPTPREEIKDLKERIKELEKKAKDLERYESYAKAADEMAALRQAFIDKGFSKTESFALLRDFTKMSTGMIRR